MLFPLSYLLVLSTAGGEDAADAGVGKAAGVMLDAVIAGDFPQLARPFATAWGALAGEETAVKRAVADKMVKDIEASKPFPMETSSGPTSRPATARSRPATATASEPAAALALEARCRGRGTLPSQLHRQLHRQLHSQLPSRLPSQLHR